MPSEVFAHQLPDGRGPVAEPRPSASGRSQIIMMLLFSLLLNRPAAALGAAGTRRSRSALREVIVHSELFARLDLTAAHVEYMPLHNAADQVWLTTVINDLRAAPARGTV